MAQTYCETCKFSNQLGRFGVVMVHVLFDCHFVVASFALELALLFAQRLPTTGGWTHFPGDWEPIGCRPILETHVSPHAFSLG